MDNFKVVMLKEESNDKRICLYVHKIVETTDQSIITDELLPMWLQQGGEW